MVALTLSEARGVAASAGGGNGALRVILRSYGPPSTPRRPVPDFLGRIGKGADSIRRRAAVPRPGRRPFPCCHRLQPPRVLYLPGPSEEGCGGAREVPSPARRSAAPLTRIVMVVSSPSTARSRDVTRRADRSDTRAVRYAGRSRCARTRKSSPVRPITEVIVGKPFAPGSCGGVSLHGARLSREEKRVQTRHLKRRRRSPSYTVLLRCSASDACAGAHQATSTFDVRHGNQRHSPCSAGWGPSGSPLASRCPRRLRGRPGVRRGGLCTCIYTGNRDPLCRGPPPPVRPSQRLPVRHRADGAGDGRGAGRRFDPVIFAPPGDALRQAEAMGFGVRPFRSTPAACEAIRPFLRRHHVARVCGHRRETLRHSDGPERRVPPQRHARPHDPRRSARQGDLRAEKVAEPTSA